MEQLSYWNRPMVLALFGAEIILSAILIILSSLTTVNSLFVVQAWVVFYAIPLAALVLISSITHFVVIARSNAILGAVVLVNFIWTIDILVVTAIFGISSFSFDGIGGDGFMIASFVFSLLAWYVRLSRIWEVEPC
jgi:hypothetical protein